MHGCYDTARYFNHYTMDLVHICVGECEWNEHVIEKDLLVIG